MSHRPSTRETVMQYLNKVVQLVVWRRVRLDGHGVLQTGDVEAAAAPSCCRPAGGGARAEPSSLGGTEAQCVVAGTPPGGSMTSSDLLLAMAAASPRRQEQQRAVAEVSRCNKWFGVLTSEWTRLKRHMASSFAGRGTDVGGCDLPVIVRVDVAYHPSAPAKAAPLLVERLCLQLQPVARPAVPGQPARRGAGAADAVYADMYKAMTAAVRQALVAVATMPGDLLSRRLESQHANPSALPGGPDLEAAAAPSSSPQSAPFWLSPSSPLRRPTRATWANVPCRGAVRCRVSCAREPEDLGELDQVGPQVFVCPAECIALPSVAVGGRDCRLTVCVWHLPSRVLLEHLWNHASAAVSASPWAGRLQPALCASPPALSLLDEELRNAQHPRPTSES